MTCIPMSMMMAVLCLLWFTITLLLPSCNVIVNGVVLQYNSDKKNSVILGKRLTRSIIDCEKYVFHPHCRGLQMKKKRIFNDNNKKCCGNNNNNNNNNHENNNNVNHNKYDHKNNSERNCVCKHLAETNPNWNKDSKSMRLLSKLLLNFKCDNIPIEIATIDDVNKYVIMTNRKIEKAPTVMNELDVNDEHIINSDDEMSPIIVIIPNETNEDNKYYENKDDFSMDNKKSVQHDRHYDQFLLTVVPRSSWCHRLLQLLQDEYSNKLNNLNSEFVNLMLIHVFRALCICIHI